MMDGAEGRVLKLPNTILIALQARAARAALTSSSMRGAGSKGVVDAGRKYLTTLNLARFGTSDAARFHRELDKATEELRKAFPRRARRWGLARKGLNIFLRDCLYTVYLRDAFHLEAAEHLLEVPLDSYSGKALCRADDTLPRWKTVRGLVEPLSDRYQSAASAVAAKHGVGRVHLDAVWWGQRTQ